MIGWSFPSRNNGDIEGFSNPALEWFKGSPLRALAREVCQNSLDAQYEEDEPVRIEFKKEFVSISSFPGMTGLQNILLKCKSCDVNNSNLITKLLLLVIICLCDDKYKKN